MCSSIFDFLNTGTAPSHRRTTDAKFQLGPFGNPFDELWKLRKSRVADCQQLFGPGSTRYIKKTNERKKFRPSSAKRRVSGKWGSKVLDIANGLSQELPKDIHLNVREMSLCTNGLIVEKKLRREILFESRV